MMGRMSIARLAPAICIAAIFVSLLRADDASIARGKYLVDEVAKCGMCHTPADETGKPDASKYLKGGALNLQPIQPIKPRRISLPRAACGRDGETPVSCSFWKPPQGRPAIMRVPRCRRISCRMKTPKPLPIT